MRPRRYHNAVFFAQQTAEKGLKAAHWHLLAKEPKLTHQVERIVSDLAGAAGGVPQEIEVALGQLSAVLERSRYPSADVEEPIPADLVDQSDAEVAVADAERILAWVTSLLQMPIGRPKPSKS